MRNYSSHEAYKLKNKERNMKQKADDVKGRPGFCLRERVKKGDLTPSDALAIAYQFPHPAPPKLIRWLQRREKGIK